MKLKKLAESFRFTKIFNGRKEAEKILLNLKQKISQEKLSPRLAVILVGENKASSLYFKLKKEAAFKIGVKAILYKFNSQTSEKEIVRKIELLNQNKKINGIIVQLPLPKKFNQDKIIKTINLGKDVDGFLENSPFQPVLAAAIFLAFKAAIKFQSLRLDSKHSEKYFNNKKILALVNSEIFGETLKNFFAQKKIKINYFINKGVSQKEIIKKTKCADIVISVCGVPNLIKNDIIKKQAILIDAGTNFIYRKKTVGDVDKESVKGKASFLTPVPGGIGPLTVALLLKNTYLAAKKHDLLNNN